MTHGARVPPTEIEQRIGSLQRHLRENRIELALLRQNSDLYYFSGTVQDGHLLIPAEGEPVFLVWRAYERALSESPLKNVEPLPSLGALPDLLKARGLDSCHRLGLELDVLPAQLYLHYTGRVWPGCEALDVTPLIRSVRAVKSPWELDRIRAACAQVAEVTALIPEFLEAGMPELDLASEVESALRKRGHPGYSRMRIWNHELGVGQILSGPEGALPAWTNTPGGGLGTSPAYGQGASTRRIQAGEPVSVDVSGCVDGYLCDQTRLFCIGGLPSALAEAYEAVLELHREIASRLVPGANCGALYAWAVERMAEKGYGGQFMGSGRTQVRFIGHGLGIEIDEYPFLAKGNPMALAPGMVVAVEPKLAFPGAGLVGIEDTYLITEAGAERLTRSPQALTVC